MDGAGVGAGAEAAGGACVGTGTGGFSTTRWSLVVEAGGGGESGGAALAELCEQYWYPLYFFARRQGLAPADAEDATQGFFEKLLEKGWVATADRGRGRFRTFLIVAMKRFLAGERERERAAKRGGGRTVLSLDTRIAESRFAAEPPAVLASEREFEKRWALELLGRAVAHLRAEYRSSGKEEVFDCLKPYLTRERGAVPYGEVAERLGLEETGARSALSRLRKRFRRQFREAVADTVADPSEVDDEVSYLVEALGWE